MEFHKFKSGDKVKTRANFIGIVIECSVKAKKNYYRVRLENGSVLGYGEEELRFYYADIGPVRTSKKLGEKCPSCNSEWTITKFGQEKWYDCIKCGKTAEELVESSDTDDFIASYVNPWYRR